MAKKPQAGVGKAEAIRQYLLQHPDATPTDVVAAVKRAHGLTVRPALVSNVKDELKKAGKIPAGSEATAAQAGESPAPAATSRPDTAKSAKRSDSVQVTLNDLLAVQDLMERFDWDADRLIAAVDGLKALKRPR